MSNEMKWVQKFTGFDRKIVYLYCSTNQTVVAHWPIWLPTTVAMSCVNYYNSDTCNLKSRKYISNFALYVSVPRTRGSLLVYTFEYFAWSHTIFYKCKNIDYHVCVPKTSLKISWVNAPARIGRATFKVQEQNITL